MKHLERAFDKQNQWWKYLLIVLAGIIGANVIGALPLIVVMVVKMLGGASVTPENMMDFRAYGIHPNLFLALMIFPFIIGLLIVVLLLKPLHKRKITEVINGTANVRWNRFFYAAAVWGIIMAGYLIVSYLVNPDKFVLRFNLQDFVPLIFISVLLIPFQTAFEEVLFRGYLAQGVGAWTKSRWMVVLLPAILFSLMHAMNPEVKEFGFWLSMAHYFSFGLLFGLVSVFDDGIEIAMGAHAANNVFLSVFVTHKASALQTPALFEQMEVNMKNELWGFLLICGVFVFLLSRKYKWDFSILARKVEPEIMAERVSD